MPLGHHLLARIYIVDVVQRHLAGLSVTQPNSAGRRRLDPVGNYDGVAHHV
ncbi:UNVERIFIED_ORG: hypothetical protein ABIB13_003540 [Arthrobacter sp. UYEF2]